MQRASFAKPPRGARSILSREAISPMIVAKDGNTRSRKLSGAARKRAARVPWPVHRQDGLPFHGGVVSGMATTMSSSPAVATIARVRKAAL